MSIKNTEQRSVRYHAGAYYGHCGLDLTPGVFWRESHYASVSFDLPLLIGIVLHLSDLPSEGPRLLRYA